MPNAPTIHIGLLKVFLQTTIQLQCWRNTKLSLSDDAIKDACSQIPEDTCLLTAWKAIAEQITDRPALTSLTQRCLQICHEKGIELRARWPRTWSESIDQWIGKRFYLSAASNFSDAFKYTSIACSQIGRHGSHFPHWPTLLDAALQHCQRHHERLLLVPDTTLSDPAEQFSQRAQLPHLKVSMDARSSLHVWLARWLERLLSIQHTSDMAIALDDLQRHVYLSPPLDEARGTVADRPLRDRVAFTLADQVMVLNVSEHGTIAKLLRERLQDPKFPLGSSFIAATLADSTCEPDLLASWMDRGAVGWLHPGSSRFRTFYLASCPPRRAHKHETAPPQHTQSLCIPIPLRMDAGQHPEDDDSVFLVHCTRGNSGPLPEESMASYLDRAWNTGHVPQAHPLISLQQIVRSAHIRGNTRLTRTSQPCVSFSAVPLLELLAARRFRSHLGRWDWEPYGLRIRRSALESLGARPVIYGCQKDYEQLDDADRPFFQARGKKDKRTGLDWSSEREWRLPGELNLGDLALESVTIFVATELQAQQLARHCPWNVAWLPHKYSSPNS
jgi:hypothetical protein